MIYAVLFAGTTYPIIPGNFGGGKPLSVKLFLTPEKRDSFEAVGIQTNNDGWSDDLKLIYKGQDSLYLEMEGEVRFSCIEIGNSVVESIRYTGGYKLTLLDLTKKLFETAPVTSKS